MSGTDADTLKAEVIESNETKTTESKSSINTESPVSPEIKDQNATECVKPETPQLIEDLNIVEAVKETTIDPETEVVKDVIPTEIKDALPVEDTSSKNSLNEENLKTSETQKLEAVGAGDSNPTVKQDENQESDINASQKIPDKIISPLATDEANKTSSNPSITPDLTKADANELTIAQLKLAVQKMMMERDAYKKKFESAEKKLAAVQTSYVELMKGGGDEMSLRHTIEQLRGKLVQTSLQLEDRGRIVTNQEKQINALNKQVLSLKEVETLTKKLLQIRNMEVKDLQAEVDAMEARMSEEREKYSTMINKMDSAVRLNADLKKEYETQLCLFRDLREKYEEKVTLLNEEKQNLEAITQAK